MGSQFAGSAGEQDSGGASVCGDDDSDSRGAKVLKRLAFMREASDVLGNKKPSLGVTGFKLHGRYHDDYLPSLSRPRRQSVASVLALASTLSAVAVYCRQHPRNERLLCLVELGFPDFEYQNEAVF